ncbi:MAG: SO_0444 family Cu/Zn efflux transporter [Candidatus Omnitrophica bacterium]|nr:SO_0444 family Cu/Zn efflux transporter [Candidatus Omnitrophota bacterium]
MNTIIGILSDSYLLFKEMAPYLLFGFIIAGVLHILVDTRTISRFLSKRNFSSVIIASIFGIPLPLCSCSVIPAAMSLRKEGASRGAVLSFLISAPTTGVDSILATYSLLGWLFTAYRVVASFIIGVIAGVLANFLIKEKEPEIKNETHECKLCANSGEHSHSFFYAAKGVLKYAFRDLVSDSGVALVIGVVIGGTISYFMPDDFITRYVGGGIKAMFVMLLIGAPMYVCATASIPIAAALMLKGINPGAAFVFLMAGPATNIVTMTVVAKSMGWKTLVVYLFSIGAGSIILGLTLDRIYSYAPEALKGVIHHEAFLPAGVKTFASIVLLGLIFYGYISAKAAGKTLKN